MTVLLSVQGVTKRFGGLQALTQVTFDLPEKQILGLIGPNGAGKTTLFNAINGVYPPEEGRIIFRDKDVTRPKAYDHARLGMARTHQIVQPLNELTVRENVMVGACFGTRKPRLGARFRNCGGGAGIRRVGCSRRANGRQPKRRAKEASGNGPGVSLPPISVTA